MLVLGWHGGWTGRQSRAEAKVRSRPGVIGHDAAAVLIRDGTVVAAIEEERLNRMKHCNFFPVQAIRFCLDAAGACLADVDAIAMDTSEEFLDLWLLQQNMLEEALPAGRGRRWIGKLFEQEFGVDVAARLVFCRHHLAHVYAAWYTSGFGDGLSLCLDAAGDGPSGLIAQCEGDRFNILRQISIDRSLGYFYLKLIGLLGYRLFDEYKVMGLAPYGDPKVYAGALKGLYRLLPQGQYALAPIEQRTELLAAADLSALFRRHGEPFTQAHKDFAAALQEALEDIVLHVLHHFRAVTGARQLCLSGGVAQNCSMNGVILRSGLFDRLHVPPVAHDAGNALGAALYAIQQAGAPLAPQVMPSVYTGTDIGPNAAIGQQLSAWQPLIRCRQVEDAPAVAAELIAQGAVIAWVQGRSEFGPRALGNRSILADPRLAANKQIINAMVKMREGYRPFAPSVLEDRARDFFELPDQVVAPFMTIIVPVRPAMREQLGAITHVDGTARIQTVTRDSNPLYYRLIEQVGRLTGVPIVLNTSFNNNAEPIVDSVEDAVTCFLTTGIDCMVVGDWVVEKVDDPSRQDAFLDLVPALPRHRRLVRRTLDDGRTEYAIDSTSHAVFGEPSISLSRQLYQILLDCDRHASIAACLARMPEYAACHDALRTELFDVWQRRGIALAPPALPSDFFATTPVDNKEEQKCNTPRRTTWST